MFFDEKYILFLWKVYTFSIKGIIILFERYNISMKKVVSDPKNVNYFRLVCNMQQLRQDGTFRQKKDFFQPGWAWKKSCLDRQIGSRYPFFCYGMKPCCLSVSIRLADIASLSLFLYRMSVKTCASVSVWFISTKCLFSSSDSFTL